MPVPAFYDIGKAAKDVLLGSKEGVFQFDQKFSVATKTADGVALTVAAVNKGDKADLSLRTVYNYKNYGLTAIFNTSDKVAVTASIDNIAPGLKATLSATLPDSSSGKLAVDYINPYVNVRSTIGLTSSPKVTLAAASGVQNIIYGGEATFDTAKSVLSGYSVGVGYHAADSQFAAMLADRLETVKIMAAHNVSRDKSLAVEISRPVRGGDVDFNVGVQKRLDNGALLKAKIDNRGLLSALYEQRLATGEKFALTSQLDTLNVGAKPAKVGVAFELA
eukprot:jgi/Chrzof1/13633/Cz08g05060.t1